VFGVQSGSTNRLVVVMFKDGTGVVTAGPSSGTVGIPEFAMEGGPATATVSFFALFAVDRTLLAERTAPDAVHQQRQTFAVASTIVTGDFNGDGSATSRAQRNICLSAPSTCA
jgi:hypothetical protein